MGNTGGWLWGTGARKAVTSTLIVAGVAAAALATVGSEAVCRMGPIRDLPFCTPDEQAALNDARARLERQDIAGAQITLRNLLQSDPESPGGRLLFARALLAQGDPAAAEVELKRAPGFESLPAEWWPQRAELMVGLGKGKELLAQPPALAKADDALAAQMLTWTARAQLQAGQPDEAVKSVQAALVKQPAYRPARVLQARLAAMKGDMPTAKAEAERLAGEDGKDAQAWLLRGDLGVMADPRSAEAAEAYRKAIELQPRLAEAQGALAMLAIRQGDFATAASAAAGLRKVQPRNGLAIYLQAIAAFSQKEFQKAHDLLQFLPVEGDARMLTLSGTVEARLANWAAAETQLTRAVQMLPDEARPRAELAAVYLRRGDPRRALDTLGPLLGGKDGDARTWHMAGQAQMQLGEFAAAEKSYAHAKTLQPGDKRLTVDAARLKIARGERDAGMHDLSEAAAAAADDPNDTSADMALVQAHLQRGDRKAALAAVEALIKKTPDAIAPLLLQGQLQAAAGQKDAARAAFDAVMRKDPANLTAVRQLAAMDVAADQPDKARERYLALLERNPRATPAMLDLAELARRASGGDAKAAEWIDRAVRVDPRDTRAWAAAIRFHQSNANNTAALTTARAAAAALPQDPDVLTLLAEVQLADGDATQAAATLAQAQQLRPTSAEILRRQALALIAAGKAERALTAAERAAELAPDSPAVAGAVISSALAAERAPKAMAVARDWQKRQPKSPLGWQMEAEVDLAQKQYATAATALRSALGKGAGSEVSWLLLVALDKSGHAAEAQAHGKTWLDEHPKDAYFLAQMGTAAVAKGDLGEAEKLFRRALEQKPNSVSDMNNLAFVLLKRQPAEALALAKKAAEVAPYSPAVLDTLAAAYDASGNAGKAAEVQGMAVDLVPRAQPYRLRLVQYLLNAGDKTKARQELERVQDQLGGNPPSELMRNLQQKLRG
jgi:putative PEP-CTERM system TPR-repeat lipoprotein